MSTRTMLLSAAVALTLALGLATPASGQHLVIDDAAGDTIDPGLDLTSLAFRNHQHSLVIDLTFVRDRPSDIIVAIKAKPGPTGGVVIKHRRDRPDATKLFVARTYVDCPRVSTTWDSEAATVRLRIPSGCLADDYGDLRFWALIESPPGRGSDVDYAPEPSTGGARYTPAVSRG